MSRLRGDSSTREAVDADLEDELGWEIPPAVACATCGSPSCEGCASSGSPRERTVSLLPWEESRESVLRRLVITAALTAEDPSRAFGQLGRGSLARAVTFAASCELLALSTLFLLVGGVSTLLFPRWILHLARDPWTWSIGSLLVIALALGMLALHVVWGLLLEHGIRHVGRSADTNLGIRFGLYACGWDLLTSPAGIVFALLSRGKRVSALLLAAVRVPRRAMNAYLRDCRGLDSAQSKIALRHSTKVVLVAFLIVVVFTTALLGGFLSHTLWS